jgi:NSS family neurotransmitter:Na+ symporter
MTLEFSVGRAAQLSTAKAFHKLEKPGTKWHIFGWASMFGNYLLMAFYTTVSGWMLAYFFKIASGQLAGLSADQIGEAFGAHISNPGALVGWMVAVCVIGFGICAIGLVSGVERVTKVMMVALFVVVFALAIRSMTLPGAGAGLAFFLKPNLDGIRQHGLGRVIYAAMGQAFFTLSLGIGSMAIFGSYIGKDKALCGEAITVTILDTCAALGAGLVIFPACFAYGVNPGAGPGLIFVTLPVIFNNMPLGQFWGALFFIFMIFAAMSTVIATFENIVAYAIDLTGCSRLKSTIINFLVVVIISLPCALSFSVLSGFTLMGGVLDVEDFILSNNLLPLGALIYALFCTHKLGWGYDNFLKEANTGSGIALSTKLKPYLVWGLPLLVIAFYISGYINMFISR